MANSAPSMGARTRAPITLLSIRQACREHGIPPSSFGRQAVRDPRFVHDLELGRTPKPETEARIAAFIANLGRA